MNKQVSKHKTAMTIGRLAEAAEVNVETIRYYQRIGLLHEPAKPLQGFRRYSHESLAQLQFIRRAKQLGFTLPEIADLLELGEGQCDDVRIRAEQKRHKIQQQIKDLQALQNTLDQLIDACHTGNHDASCPIVETLSRKDSLASEKPG